MRLNTYFEDESDDVYVLEKFPFPFYILSTDYHPDKYVDDGHLVIKNGQEFYGKLKAGNKTMSRDIFPTELLDFLPESKRYSKRITLPKYYEIEDNFLKGGSVEPVVDIPKLEGILLEMDNPKPDSFVLFDVGVFYLNDSGAGDADELAKSITTYQYITEWAKDIREKAENTFYQGVTTLGDVTDKAYSGIDTGRFNHEVLTVSPSGHVVNIGS